MSAELHATGVVVSTDPLVTVTADLRNHELVLTLRLPDYHPVNAADQTHTIHIGGQKLQDLIRFAQLANGLRTWCWRCGKVFVLQVLADEYCPICHMAAHCDACSEYLHASQP